MSINPLYLRPIKTYVRREGRMTAHQLAGISLYWQKYGLNLEEGKLDFSAVFGNKNPVIIEIGFGMGTSLWQMAAQNPQLNYLGIEVHRPGVGALLADIADLNLANVRVYNADALQVLTQCIPDHSISGFQIFFPDPWPKTRHHKRRLIQEKWVLLVIQKLKMQGFIHLATDIEDYALQMEAVLSKIPGLIQQSAPPRPHTKFETRALKEGRQIFEIAGVVQW